jgi:hypothetical protein
MKDINVCKDLTFSDCELAILRMSVDKAEEKIGKRIVQSEDLKKIIEIVENFIKLKNVICYGGTAINNILPQDDQFYNKDIEIPDYDFFTPTALNDAKELADIYYREGFTDVEAKSGQHHGTYKVFVNYMPVADLTQLPTEIYNAIKKESIRVSGILYAPPNFLRMSMYLELSRPEGDISRWEKVLKRLTLLNKHYPLTNLNCNKVNFQREMSNEQDEYEIYSNIRNTFVNQGVVFFGGYALSLYSNYMPKHMKNKIENIADFDVLSNDPHNTAEIVKERLKDVGIKNVKIIKREPVGDIIPEHYEIIVGKDTVAFVYKPIACHSYNVLNIKGQKVKIATIDTMLSFYLAFLYTNRPYYNHFLDRILCISKFLFEVQQKNRLKQTGLLKRFSISCYGHQETVEEMRSKKTDKYKELKQSKNKAEYEEWFLNYKPDTQSNKSKGLQKHNKNNVNVEVSNKDDTHIKNNKGYTKKMSKTNKNKNKTKRKPTYSFFGLFKNKNKNKKIKSKNNK